MDSILHYYTIQVIAIPVEDCGSFIDCTSCSSLEDPLCGWCSIERKCSRRSECRNNNETKRWIQDQTMCIAIVDFAILPNVLSVQMINQKVCSVAYTLFLSHTRLHTHTRIYTHARMHMHTHIMHTCTYIAQVHVHTCTCTHAHSFANMHIIYLHICIHAYTHVRIYYIRTCAPIYTYLHTHMHIHTHTHAQAHTGTYIHHAKSFFCSLS